MPADLPFRGPSCRAHHVESCFFLNPIVEGCFFQIHVVESFCFEGFCFESFCFESFLLRELSAARASAFRLQSDRFDHRLDRHRAEGFPDDLQDRALVRTEPAPPTRPRRMNARAASDVLVPLSPAGQRPREARSVR
ncbi:MAG: hypothetical protein CMN31_15250 [Sandaracinus sp.]|nr:hypothetical protein [Myxococcales bacterium]MAT24943.1 hypothetical protein [Sandaracinus sp.]MBJ72668.1 hypothetical protein [Sandaracinus sp.]